MIIVSRLKIEDQRGQALVEFALMVPLLLMLLLGIIEFGRVYYAQLAITSAARQGARISAVHTANNDPVTVENLAVQLGVLENDHISSPAGTVVTSSLPLTEPEIIWTRNAGTGYIEITRTPSGSPTDVTVTIQYPVRIIAPLIDKAFVHNPVLLESSCVMQIEN